MKFITIKPATEAIEWLESEEPNPYHCTPLIGIERLRTDTGTLARAGSKYPGLAIIVYEFGLMEPHWTEFFVLGKQLYVGNALFYAFDHQGDTVDCIQFQFDTLKRQTFFYHSRQAVVKAVHDGLVHRPQTSITTMDKDGNPHTEVLWTWSD